jgi:hypothetical protein
MNTAIKTEPVFRNDDGWLGLAVCPQCHALVLSDETHAFGDQTDGHERWHAATDHPVPENLRPEVVKEKT